MGRELSEGALCACLSSRAFEVNIRSAREKCKRDARYYRGMGSPRTAADGSALAGSQRQIQLFVNQYPDQLNQAILLALPDLAAMAPGIEWRSPLRPESYREYGDKQFMDAIGLAHLSDRLVGSFWPTGGPKWDALARLALSDNENGVLLLEAKSHRLELCSCCAASKESRKLIQRAFTLTQTEWLNLPRQRPWFSPVYQYANRIAHLCFLRHVLGVQAWLVNVYFLGERRRPTTRHQWLDLLPEVHAELGLSKTEVPFCGDVFLEAKNDRI